MGSTTVQQILTQIEALSDHERDLLRQRLDQRDESEWQQAAEAARRDAASNGISEARITDAIETVRYGPPQRLRCSLTPTSS